jgi:SAM-dependent methyltransferase
VQRFATDAKRVLEVGCGTGFVLQSLRSILPDAQIAGSELHSLGLTHARGRCATDVELFQMDARRGGLTGVLDLVGAFDVLEHIPEDEKVLADIFSSLRPGGHLIVSVPQHPWLWSTADDLAKHQRRYKVGEMARKARAAGFTIRYQTSFVTLALPLMLASRLLARMKPEPRTLAEQTDAEFRLSPVANGLLMSICRLEHVLRRVGVPLPIGGSNVLVAQKPL